MALVTGRTVAGRISLPLNLLQRFWTSGFEARHARTEAVSPTQPSFVKLRVVSRFVQRWGGLGAAGRGGVTKSGEAGGMGVGAARTMCPECNG
jgi:hypothetical protein